MIITWRNLRKVRRTQHLSQDTVINILDKKAEICDQDNIAEKIEEFYTELIDRQQSQVIPKKVKSR